MDHVRTPAARPQPLPLAPAARRILVTLPERAAYHGLLVVVAFLSLFPIFWLFSGSLQSAPELYGGVTILPRTPQFRNYATAWTEGHFGTFLGNSLLYASVTVAVILFVASMAGYALARIEFPGRAAVLGLILAVMIVPLPASFVALYKLLIALGLGEHPGGVRPRAHGRRAPHLDLHPARLLRPPAAGARGRRGPRRLLDVGRVLADHAAAGPARPGRGGDHPVPVRLERVPARAGDVQHRRA